MSASTASSTSSNASASGNSASYGSSSSGSSTSIEPSDKNSIKASLALFTPVTTAPVDTVAPDNISTSLSADGSATAVKASVIVFPSKVDVKGSSSIRVPRF